MRKLLIISVVFLGLFLVGFQARASLAPQIYLTDLKISKRAFDPGEKIEGYVGLLNYENWVISDLTLRFQILSYEVDGVATKIIDEKSAKEIFTLSPKREIRKPFEYVLPSNMPNDNFKYRVQVTNSRGEEMGWIDKVISVGGDGKFLRIDNYWIIKDNKKIPAGAGALYSLGDLPQIEFDIINNSSFTIEAFPKIITYKRNVGGEILFEQEEKSIILTPQEKRTLKIKLPQAAEPETYLSELRFYERKNEEAISGPVYFRWLIKGDNAQILFVKPDKVVYKKGDKAKIKVQFAGLANYYSLSAIPKGILTLKMFNDREKLIGESRKEVELIDGGVKMNVLLKENINGPKIEATLTKNGNILDSYSFRVVPESEVVVSGAKTGFDIWINILRIILTISIIIIFTVAVYYFINKEKNKPQIKNKIGKKNINLPFLFFIFIVSFVFLFSFGKKTYAATEVTGGCQDTLMIYNSPLPARLYKIGDVINFSGKFRTTSSASSLFFNKITFYIAKDKDIPVSDCCGDKEDSCYQDIKTSCMCKEGYIDYYGASSSFYKHERKFIRWFDEVKYLTGDESELYKLGTIYPSDTIYGDSWVAFNKSFFIPDDLNFSGPVRFYVQYSGTNFQNNWQWSISYQKGWISENEAPIADSLSLDGEPDYCNVGEGRGKLNFKWRYIDPDKDRQSAYQFQLAKNNDFSSENLIIDYLNEGVEGDPSGSINTSPAIMVSYNPDSANMEISYNSSYWWRVRVKDEKGNWSLWQKGKEIKTPSQAYPRPSISWNSESIGDKKRIQFNSSQSKCYRQNGEEYFCKDNKSARYQWDFDYKPLEGFKPDSSEKNPVYIYPEFGQYVVRLEISDNKNSCYQLKNIEITEGKLPLPPGFKPKAPTSRFNSFLSAVFSLFNFHL